MDEANLGPFGGARISAVKIRPVERARTGVALIGSAMCQRRRMGGIDRRRVVAQKSGHDAVPRRRGLAVLRLADPDAPFVAHHITTGLIAIFDLQPATEMRHHRIIIDPRSAEHTSELQSLMRLSYAVF